MQLYAIRITKIELTERLKLHVGLALRRGMPAVLIPILLATSFAYYETGIFENEIAKRDFSMSVRKTIATNVNYLLESEKIKDSDLLSDISDTEREQTIDKIFAYISERISFYEAKYEKYIPPVLAFGLFLILWALSFIFIWSSAGVAMIIYEILRITKFIRIETEKVDAQRLYL